MLHRLFVFLLAAGTAFAADIAGEWEIAITYLNDTSHARVMIKADGDAFTGTMNEVKLVGTRKDGHVAFNGTRPGGDKYGTFEGRLDGDQMEGTATRGSGRSMTWTAKRAAARPEKPQVHNFEPTHFSRVFSDATPPVLRVFPGDTVRTWTVDAGGNDRKDERLSQGGNPQTGPFYVEGAMPGDTLKVKLTRVRLNRDSAGSGARIVPTALTPGYVERTKYSNDVDSTWVLDREKGVARLKKPSAHLKNYTVKLQPMVGCIAVAPPSHMAFRTGYLGVFGGNLDYNQLREGTTISLPVFAPGALLFIGDGHAAQGDGELAGDALETSLEVEFTVDVVRGEFLAIPRAENDEYLMSLGVANSLLEALQAATTDLAKWLQRDYKLDPNEAAMVLGTAMQYNIAEVVDPLMHVVAKIRKEALAGLK